MERIGLKLRQLEAMRAVMVKGTTTHAAEMLSLTQSAVSRLITQLEQELGLKVFDRRHGRLVITPEGRHVYDMALRVLDGVDQITATARDVRTLQAGAMRIISMPSLGYGLLPDTIVRINRRYSQVKIYLDVGWRRDLEDGISGGQYDFGVATLPINQEALEIEPLCTLNAVFVAPKDHPLAEKEVVVPEDLEGLPFISLDARTLLRYRTDEMFGKMGIRRVLGIEAHNTLMLCNLVAKGLGVSIVHPFIANYFLDHLIVRPFEPSMAYDFGVVFAKAQRQSLVSREFISALHEDVELLVAKMA